MTTPVVTTVDEEKIAAQRALRARSAIGGCVFLLAIFLCLALAIWASADARTSVGSSLRNGWNAIVARVSDAFDTEPEVVTRRVLPADSLVETSAEDVPVPTSMPEAVGVPEMGSDASVLTGTVITVGPLFASVSLTGTVPAGMDFYAIGVHEVEGDTDWLNLAQATNREYCAFYFDFQHQYENTLKPQWSNCIQMNMTGTGVSILTVRPNQAHYDDHAQGEQAFWMVGNSGTYAVSRDNGTTWSEEIPLDTGAAGIKFPKGSPEVLIRVTLANGFMTMQLGPIRHDVLPVH